MATTTRPRRGGDAFCIPRDYGPSHVLDLGQFRLLANNMPLRDGHMLIVTKEHVAGLLDLSPEQALELLRNLFIVLPLAKDVYGDGVAYDLKIRSGILSGWTKPHFHVHVIVRSLRDRFYTEDLRNLERSKIDTGPMIETLNKVLESNGYLHPVIPQWTADMTMAGVPQSLAGTVFFDSKYFFAAHHPDPIMRGHSVLVPKRHIGDFLELTERELGDLVDAYCKVMTALLHRYGNGAMSYITTLQVGGYPGMVTDRFHMNLIPRSPGDAYANSNDLIYAHLYEPDEWRDVPALGRMKGADVEVEAGALAAVFRP